MSGGGQYKPANSSSLYQSNEGVAGGHNVQPGQSEEAGGKDHDIKMKPNGISVRISLIKFL